MYLNQDLHIGLQDLGLLFVLCCGTYNDEPNTGFENEN